MWPLLCPHPLTAPPGSPHPSHVACSVGTQPQQHFDGKIYEESNYCCWEGIKTIFHSPRPWATSAGATLGALCASHLSLWPAITGADYSSNSLLIGSGTEMAINARHSACLPSRGCRQRRPRRASGVWWMGPICALPAALAWAGALKWVGASPATPAIRRYSTEQAPTHPAVPHSNATSSGEPSLMPLLGSAPPPRMLT